MKKSIIIGLFAALTATSFTSCLDTESNRFVDADRVLTPQDSVYQMLGVLTNIKGLAARYVVLGEVRGDLMTTTEYATTDLKELNDFNISSTNSYVSKKEYYKVINQCNYIIQYGEAIPKERAAAITLRAWTYLQLVLNYGKTTYYEEFINTDAEANADYPQYNIDQLTAVLIPQLEAIRDVNFPTYGTIGQVDIKTQLLNAKFVLGDLYLWAAGSMGENGGKAYYERAAQLYYDLIVNKSSTAGPFLSTIPYQTENSGDVITISTNAQYIKWTSERYLGRIQFWGRFLYRESVSYIDIPNPDSCTVRSNIDTLCGSPFYMKEDISLTATSAATTLWNSSEYAFTLNERQYEENPYLKYVIPESANYDKPGDLRLTRSFADAYSSTSNGMSQDSVILKYDMTSNVSLIRVATLYLRYAEAVNRAGKPGLAMVALKYGLNRFNVNMYMPNSEKPGLKYLDPEKTVARYSFFSYDKKRKLIVRSGSLNLPVNVVEENKWVVPAYSTPNGQLIPNAQSDTLYYCFNDTIESYYDFTSLTFDGNFGLHSRGSGCAAADTTYKMPSAVYPNDVQKQMEYVENLLCNEYAYETAFEGNRFQDLMRFSRHQNNWKFLVDRMKRKNSALGGKLSERPNAWDCESWYLLYKSSDPTPTGRRGR